VLFRSSWPRLASVNLVSQASARVNVSSATAFVPALSAGEYFLGVIITNSDVNPSNNTTQGDDVLSFGVLCSPQAPPSLANPDPYYPCAPTDITLAWGSVSGIGVSYEVKVGTSLDSGMTVYATNITQHLVTGLTELTRYYWRVRAITSCGAVGTWSSAREFTTTGTLVEIPKIYPGPEEACVDPSFAFAWDEIPGAASYRVKISDLAGGTTVYADATGNSVSYPGLIPGVRYYWTIKPKDGCGFYGSYGSRYFFTLKDSTPLTPVLATPVANICLGPDILFETESNAVITEHDFEIQTAAGAPAYQNTGPGTEWLLSNMSENDYRWRARVLSCTTGGLLWGAWTGWEYFSVDTTAPALSEPPTSPSHMVGQWSGQSLVNINWTAATDACGVAAYWYSWDQSPGSTPDDMNSVDGQSDSLEGEVPDGDYNWFHIVAVDSVGNVSPPQHLGPFMIDLTPPSLPMVSSSLPSGSWQNAVDLTVIWEESVDATSGIAGYSIAWSTNSAYVLDESVDTSDLTATQYGVSEGPNYFYVKAVDGYGNASLQVQYILNVDRGDPWVAPFEISGSYESGELILIEYNFNDLLTFPAFMRLEHEYTPDNGVTWYAAEICDSQAGSNCDQYGVWPIDGGTGPFWPKFWLLPWVNTSEPINMRVTAIDLAGNRGSQISMNGIQIYITTGVDTDTPVVAFELNGNAPNPFNPSTTIRYAIPRASQVKVVIYDVTGRKVRTLVDEAKTGPARYEAIWNGQNDLGQVVASGVYVYRLQAGSFVEAKRMTLLK